MHIQGGCALMRSIRNSLTLLVPLALSACGGYDDHYYPGYAYPPAGTYANFQIVNASPDAPPIEFQIDGTTVVRHLDYGQGTAEQPITPTSHSFAVQIDTPGGPTSVVGPVPLNAAANMDYVVAVEGNSPVAGVMPSQGMTAIVFPHPLAVVPSGSTQIQVLNAAVGSPLSVYLTVPGADLTSSAALGTVPFGGSLGPTQVQAGEWEIRVTGSTAGSAVLYDSGTIELAGGSDVVVSILTSTLPPPASTLQLAAVDASGKTRWLAAL